MVNSINPLKLYEYLACGLPVIATAWDELVSINSPALLYHSHIEFVELLKKVIDTPQNSQNEYKMFAKKQDWLERVTALLTNLRLE